MRIMINTKGHKACTKLQQTLKMMTSHSQNMKLSFLFSTCVSVFPPHCCRLHLSLVIISSPMEAWGGGWVVFNSLKVPNSNPPIAQRAGGTIDSLDKAVKHSQLIMRYLCICPVPRVQIAQAAKLASWFDSKCDSRYSSSISLSPWRSKFAVLQRDGLYLWMIPG